MEKKHKLGPAFKFLKSINSLEFQDIVGATFLRIFYCKLHIGHFYHCCEIEKNQDIPTLPTTFRKKFKDTPTLPVSQVAYQDTLVSYQGTLLKVYYHRYTTLGI